MKKKKNTVTAWAFAWQSRDSGLWHPCASAARITASLNRAAFATDHVVGPITRIELPLPKAKKGKR